MVGISLALLLARANRDWDVVLLESFPLDVDAKRPFQSSFDARSTALSAGSRNILESCGIWPALSEHLTPIRKVHVSDRGHLGGSTIFGAEHGLDAVGYVAENAWLGRVLMGQLQQQPTVRCCAPVSVLSADATSEGYRLTLDSEEQLACRLLVLADGADSGLRAQLGIGVDRHDYRQSAIIANVRCDRPHRGVAYERFTAAGPIALLPLGESDHGDTMALVWTRPGHDAAQLRDCSDEEFLGRLQQAFGHRQGRFLQVSTRHLYPLQLLLAREQVRRALVLMGNAAHFLHPVAGQGFNLALRDCQALSECLAQGAQAGVSPGDLKLLEQYQARQATDQWTTIQMSDHFVRWFSSSDAARSILRNIGLGALGVLPPVKAALARQTMGLIR